MNNRDHPSPAERRGIFLIEDHSLIRAGFRTVINREKDLYVCGEAEDVPATLDFILRTRPSLVVLDITLKTGDGIELAKDLTSRNPGLPILVMSMHNENSYAARAIRSGARGYLMKDEGPEKLMAAIRTLLAGKIFLSERFRGKFGAAQAVRESGLFVGQSLQGI